jgi:hypothetical protein
MPAVFLFYRRWSPLISLVLPVKNAMPHVRQTIQALRRQTYRNFELLVQDGVSTDGTLEYLQSVRDLPRIEIVSQSDGGVGEAYNRGIARSSGDLICLIAADECLDDNALEKGVRWFRRHPGAAVVYGGVRIADAAGAIVQVFIPPRFDLMRFIHNEIFPTTAGFLNRERIGSDMYYDAALKTCPDYDFWIRLGSRFAPRDLVVVPEPIVVARGDRTSMSYRVESVEQFVRDKLFILNRYLSKMREEQKPAALRASASAGILTWAAETVLSLEGPSPEFLKWCREAATFDPHSRRLSALARMTEVFEVDASGRFSVLPRPQPLAPCEPTVRLNGILRLNEIRSDPLWRGAKVDRGMSVRVTTPKRRWAYSALVPLPYDDGVDDQNWYWARLNMKVHTGQVGIGLLSSDGIFSERLVSPMDGRVDVFVRLNQLAAAGVMIRNGECGGRSLVEIFDTVVEYSPKAGSAGGVGAAPAGRFSLGTSPRPFSPCARTVRLDGILRLDKIRSDQSWRGAKVDQRTSVRVRTAKQRWAYSALIPLSSIEPMDDQHWYRARLNVRVCSGEVGIGLLCSNDIFSEHLVSPKDGRVDVFVKLDQLTGAAAAADADSAGAVVGVMIRNGRHGGRSIVEIFDAAIEYSPKADPGRSEADTSAALFRPQALSALAPQQGAEPVDVSAAPPPGPSHDIS